MKTYPIKQFYSIVVSTSPRARRNIPFFEMNAGDTENFTGVAKMKQGDKVIIYVSTGKEKTGGIYGLGTVLSDAHDGINPATEKTEKRVDIRFDYICPEDAPLLTYEEVCPSILGQVVRPQYIRHEISRVEKLFMDKGLEG